MNYKNIILTLALCSLFPATSQASDAASEPAKFDNLKPLTQQLHDSPVGKWLNVWGDYGFTLGYSLNNEKLADYPGVNHSLTYENKVRFGLRSKPIKGLTFDVSMEYASNHSDNYRDMNQGYSSYYLAANALYPDSYPLVSRSSSVESDYLELHRAYATLELCDQQLKLAAGRRPSGESVPLSQLQNKDQIDDRGDQSLLGIFRLDGFALSYAPAALSSVGSYAKISFGHGYEYGYDPSQNILRDSNILSVSLNPINVEAANIWFQWSRGFNTDNQTVRSDIDWFSLGSKGKLDKVGPGSLHGFIDFGLSQTYSGSFPVACATFTGLLSGSSVNCSNATAEKTGYSVFTGIRYDLPTKTKIGFEYNYGSKDWISSSTTKVATRGHVYEPFVIQEINLKPITSIFSKTFFRAGYRYFDYEVNNLIIAGGAPITISSIASSVGTNQNMTPYSYTVYGAFEVHF